MDAASEKVGIGNQPWLMYETRMKCCSTDIFSKITNMSISTSFRFRLKTGLRKRDLFMQHFRSCSDRTHSLIPQCYFSIVFECKHARLTVALAPCVFCSVLHITLHFFLKLRLEALQGPSKNMFCVNGPLEFNQQKNCVFGFFSDKFWVFFFGLNFFGLWTGLLKRLVRCLLR